LDTLGPKGEAAVTALIEVLESETDSDVRISVLWALGSVDRAGKSLAALCRLVNNGDDRELRKQAFQALARIDQSGKEIADALRRMIEDDDKELLENALQTLIPTTSLAMVGVKSPDPTVFDLEDAARLARQGGYMPPQTADMKLTAKAGPVMDVIIEAFNAKEPAIRRIAYPAAIGIGYREKRMRPVLLQALEEAQPDKIEPMLLDLMATGLPARDQADLLMTAERGDQDDFRDAIRRLLERDSPNPQDPSDSDRRKHDR